MNFEATFQRLHSELKDVKTQLEKLEETFRTNKKYTSDFLAVCEELGIKTVAIQTRSKRVKASVDFPFGVAGSVFASGYGDGKTWPVIWKAVEIFNISGGCGNIDQHSISSEAQSKLVDGVYTLKQGQWNRIDKV